MRNRLVPVLLLALALGLACYFVFFKPKQAPVQPPQVEQVTVQPELKRPARTNAPPAPGAVAPAPEPAAETAVPPLPRTPSISSPVVQNLPPPEPGGLPPATVLENMRTVFRNYASMFGSNPVGTNPEITKALTGDNPKQVKFINPESGLRINDSGELVDPWGTPFFFHQLSGTDMEIHSAGPDRKMWTADDLVIR